jgi:hypothetical protein
MKRCVGQGVELHVPPSTPPSKILHLLSCLDALLNPVPLVSVKALYTGMIDYTTGHRRSDQPSPLLPFPEVEG